MERHPLLDPKQYLVADHLLTLAVEAEVMVEGDLLDRAGLEERDGLGGSASDRPGGVG